MKGRSKSSGLAREEDSSAEKSSQVPKTEGRPGAANLNNCRSDLRIAISKVSRCDVRYRIPRVLFLRKHGKELEWYHGKVILDPSRLQSGTRGFFTFNGLYGTVECVYYRL